MQSIWNELSGGTGMKWLEWHHRIESNDGKVREWNGWIGTVWLQGNIIIGSNGMK